MSDDPFAVLGLGRGASADEVRTARRELAKRHHPDRGGDAATMRRLNEAADAALARIAAPPSVPSDPAPPEQASGNRTGPDATSDGIGGRIARDMPSFTVEALPVDTFEGLLVVASWIGEVLDDDPPYRLEVHLHEPVACWCQLDVVPDAGASTVSLTVAGLAGAPAPDVVVVRDIWVELLNRVDWS